jgi:hypothetical protein
MASIQQKQLFVWQEIEELGDLERLVLTLTYLPDEELVKTLERKGNKGIDTYPVRPVWNSIIAGVIYEHVSVERLRRELQRNAELRGIIVYRYNLTDQTTLNILLYGHTMAIHILTIKTKEKI